MSWPRVDVEQDEPEQERVRPRVADDVDQPVGELLRSAARDHRRRERDHPADEDHRRPRDSAVGLVDGEYAGEDDRARGEEAGDGGRHEAGGEQDHHPGEDRRAPAARPAPSGTAWRRISAGASTTSTSGSSRWYSSVSQAPCSSSVSPAASVVSPPSVLVLALDREDDEVAALGRHPRVHRRRRSGPSAAGRRPRRRPALAHERRAGRRGRTRRRALGEVAEVARHRPRLAGRQQPLAEEDDDRDRPGERAAGRRARTRRSRSAPRRRRRRTRRR